MIEFDLAGPDKHLFKYCSLATAKIVLETGQLRWSRPTLFNDLYDSQFDLRTIENEEALQPRILERLWEFANKPEHFRPENSLGILHKWGAPAFVAMGKEAYFEAMADAVLEGIRRGKKSLPRFFKEIRELVARTKILCLSEDPLSTSLWGHYGDSGRSVVLEFCSIPVLDSPYSVAKKVLYLDEPPLLYDEDFFVDQMSGLQTYDGADILQKMVFVKHSHWGLEREWRIASGDGRLPDDPFEDVGFHPMELSSVLVGPRVTADQVDELRGLLHRRYLLTRIVQVEVGQGFDLILGKELPR
ncbi:MAG TPA: DUF2971 domain-containing protein [Allosphingosinicella sp.]|nr:DUF2971 domain-containing protein [Allosphingosinicella sp.]